MSNESELTKKEEILELASLWISRLDRGLTPEEEMALNRWLDESEVHAKEFVSLATLWDNLSSLSRFR